jgi:hypothetical protein
MADDALLNDLTGGTGGRGAASPEPSAGGRPPLDLPMSEEAFTQWQNRVDASKRFTKGMRDRWKVYVQAYMARVLDHLPKDGRVNVPLEYAFVELKSAQLAFQVPEFHLAPRNPTYAAATPLFQAVVNFEVGADRADLKTCLDQCLFDVLTCGIAAGKIGYVAHVRQRPKINPPGVDPLTGQPTPAAAAVDPMTGEPVLEDYIAGEEYFIDHMPCEHLLVQSGFVGSNFDKAGWLGYVDELPLDIAIALYGITEDEVQVYTEPVETLSSKERPTQEPDASSKRVRRIELFYQAEVYDGASRPLPGQFRQLVMLDGFKGGPVVHKDSPYQWVGDGQEGRPNDGKLHGMRGNPIDVLTIRVLAGSAYPVSDVEMGLAQSQEISMGRTQMMRHRDRAKAYRTYNRTKIDLETKRKIDAGEDLDWVGVDENVNECFGVVAPPAMNRETFTFDEVAKEDFKQTWAISTVGNVDPSSPTATEVRQAAGATDVRLDKERTWVLRWLVRVARKFASLLQQFKDDQDFVEVIGQDGLPALQQWDRKAIAGEFVFTAKPDSALRMDAESERRQALQLYNQIGKDPNVRRTELLRSLIAKYGMDHAKIVVETPPEEPKLELPKGMTLSVKPEDLGNPQILGMLKQAGFEIMPPTDPVTGQLQQPQQAPQQAGALVQSPHPGPMPTMDVINKHQQRTGGVAPVN